jgi:hypothetical protein
MAKQHPLEVDLRDGNWATMRILNGIDRQALTASEKIAFAQVCALLYLAEWIRYPKTQAGS